MDFIKSKWLKHVLKEDGIDRHYYEFSVWTELCNHLRSGDIWVPGSKQYKNFDEYLLPVQTWEEIKRKQQIPLSIATNVDEYLQNRCGLMQEQLTMVNQLIRNQELSDVSVYGGHIQIPSLKRMFQTMWRILQGLFMMYYHVLN